jgi:diacylglycerol kinase (ATP)
MARGPRVFLVANPAAGGGPEALAGEVAERCRAAGAEVEMATTEAPRQAVELAADAVAGGRAPPALVLAVGGDGTVAEVAEGLARGLGRWPDGDGAVDGDGGPRLLVVPAGSGNSAYAALWGEAPWHELLAAALEGRCSPRAVDLVRVVEADRASFLGVNVGLVARIAELIEARKAEARSGAPEDPQQRYWEAIGEALQTLAPFPARVAVDGEVLHEGGVTLGTVGGVRRFGRGSFDVLPRSLIDDGLLDACVIAEVSDDGLAALVQLVPAGQHLDRPEVAYAQGRAVEITRTDGAPLSLEHDGDPRPAGETVTLTVVPAALPTLALP